MKNIEVKILNPEAVAQARKMMVCAARLTQRGHKIKNLADFEELYERSFTDRTVETMASLPHPTIQKFAVINVVVVGASRRFLAQITRHQNEVKFMSASLQYSDYSGQADFVTPYELYGTDAAKAYLEECIFSMGRYRALVEAGYDNDSAGYCAPQGLRNVLIISATPYQWKHMIGQRICRRNTQETRYVMLKIWNELFKLDPILFSPETTGPHCMRDNDCQEGKMSCGDPFPFDTEPSTMLSFEFPKYCEEGKS